MYNCHRFLHSARSKWSYPTENVLTTFKLGARKINIHTPGKRTRYNTIVYLSRIIARWFFQVPRKAIHHTVLRTQEFVPVQTQVLLSQSLSDNDPRFRIWNGSGPVKHKTLRFYVCYSSKEEVQKNILSKMCGERKLSQRANEKGVNCGRDRRTWTVLCFLEGFSPCKLSGDYIPLKAPKGQPT